MVGFFTCGRKLVIEKFAGTMIEDHELHDINDLKILGMLVYVRYFIRTSKNPSLDALKNELSEKYNISPRFISKYLWQLYDLDLIKLKEE